MLWKCGHLSYNDSECICKRYTWQATQFKLLQFICFVGGGSKRQRWRIVRRFPLLTLCPCNLALPFNEGERKYCQDATLWANKLPGSVRLEAGCGEPSSWLPQWAAPKPWGRCGAGLSRSPSAPSHVGFSASISSFFPLQVFWSFFHLFVVSLSIPLLLQALLGGFASLLAFSNPGTFKCENDRHDP